jgi:exopolysaccharide biosynthesis predicted pyruvyltransferase EpsI
VKKFILVNDTTTQNNWGCHSTTKHFSDFFCNNYIKKYSIDLHTLHSMDATQRAVSSYELSDVDFVAINGEGSIYDFQLKGVNILRTISLLKSAKPNIKILFLNSTFDLRDERMQKELSQIVDCVDIFCAREPASLENLQNIGVKNVILQPDFLYGMMQLEDCDNEDYVVVGGNSNYYRPDRKPYDAAAAYDELVCELINAGNSVVLYSSDLKDIPFLSPVAEKFNLKHITCKETDWKKAFEILSSARLSISGRYHPSIMSLCGNTPCYFISANNCKMLGTNYFLYEDDKNFTYSHSLQEDIENIIQWTISTSRDYAMSVNLVREKMTAVAEALCSAKDEIRKCIEE